MDYYTNPVVTPSILKDCLIMLAHDEQGHNGFKRTYGSLQTVYYWKGMKRQIQLHCRRCRTCNVAVFVFSYLSSSKLSGVIHSWRCIFPLQVKLTQYMYILISLVDFNPFSYSTNRLFFSTIESSY